MTNYRLYDAGYSTYKKIVVGRKWIGRVSKVENGYLGTIGKTKFAAVTEIEAFKEVVARHLGYASASAMSDRNAKVRADNRAARLRALDAVDRALNHGDFDRFDALLHEGE